MFSKLKAQLNKLMGKDETYYKVREGRDDFEVFPADLEVKPKRVKKNVKKNTTQKRNKPVKAKRVQAEKLRGGAGAAKGKGYQTYTGEEKGVKTLVKAKRRSSKKES